MTASALDAEEAAAGSAVLRVGRAFLCGVGAGAAVLTLRSAGLLDSWRGVAMSLVLILALPVSESLGRRILLVGSIGLGWLPLLWWWRLPTGSFGRVSWLLALVAAGLATWVLLGTDVRSRAARLLPRWRVVDAVIAGVAAATAWLLGPWLLVSTGPAALAMLSRGWDHAAHYWSTAAIRQNGVVLAAVTPPDNSGWVMANYPAGSHGTVALVAELLAGPTPGDPSAELVTYAHAMGIVVIGATVLVVAGLCTAPWLLRRPLLALPAAVFVSAALLLGPGGRLVIDGFVNFYLGVALAAASVLIAIALPRPLRPVWLLALGGTVAGVAQTWLLLLAMAGMAVLLLPLPMSRNRWRGTTAEWVVAGLVAAATTLTCLASYDRVSGGGLTGGAGSGPSLSILVHDGLITVPPAAWLALPVAAALIGCLALGLTLERRRRSTGMRVRTAAAVIVVAVGAAVSVGLATLQLRVGGELTYYFWKFSIGVALVSTVIATACASVITDVVLPVRRPSPRRRVISSVALAALATQAFGPTSMALPSTSPGVAARAELVAYAADPAPTFSRIIAAAAAQQPMPPGAHPVLLPHPATGAIDAQSAAQWFLAFTGSWSGGASNTVRTALNAGDWSPTTPTLDSRRILTRDPHAIVVVGPEVIAEVREGLAPDGLEDRVRSW